MTKFFSTNRLFVPLQHVKERIVDYHFKRRDIFFFSEGNATRLGYKKEHFVREEKQIIFAVIKIPTFKGICLSFSKNIIK